LPIYTYVCTACGAGIERRQSFSDAALTICEVCSGQLRRVVHPVGVIFKGSGFYNTDYKNKAGSNGSDAKEDGAAKTEASKPAETAAASKSSGEATKSAESSTASTGASKSGDSGTGSAPPAAAGKT
jgi:putative FmdB family regulatory protein